MGGRALGAQAALSEVRREQEGPCQTRARLDLMECHGCLGPGMASGAFEADCGRLGWEGELEQLVQGAAQCALRKDGLCSL